jgi:RNA polymerase sigma factor (TIGR02999 family)
MSDEAVVELLKAFRSGDAGAFERLVPLVYEDLRLIARRQVRFSRGLTLDTTALVHEAYLKMANQKSMDVVDRNHFLAVCAKAMRQYVVSHARAWAAEKRSAAAGARLTLDPAELGVDFESDQLVLLDQALEHLGKIDERLVRIFECRYFAGLSESETAKALSVPLRTVQRGWQQARGWLRMWLTQ